MVKFRMKQFAICTLTLTFISPVNVLAFANQDIFNFTRIEYVNPSADGTSAIITTSNITNTKSHWQRSYTLYYRDANQNLNNLNTDTNIVQPTLSPDDKYVAYLNNTNDDSTIYLVKLANNQKTKLVTFPGSISAFKWSPSGNYIAFVANQNAKPFPVDIFR